MRNELLELVKNLHDNARKELNVARNNNDNISYNYLLGAIDSYNNVIRELDKY